VSATCNDCYHIETRAHGIGHTSKYVSQCLQSGQSVSPDRAACALFANRAAAALFATTGGEGVMKLSDKIVEAARAAIEQQEGVPAAVFGWRVRGTRHNYEVVVSVAITTEKGYNAFEVGMVVDLNTEEITRE